ncbi:MAG: VWA domain-containing protein [Armatimonadota bacterium]
MSGLALMAPLALVALVPLGAIIVLLYLLKLRRREVTVPSVLLWRRSVEDVQANAPLQRLRMNLLLLLQLVALTALVLGLAAPYVMARLLPNRTAVIVLDASASMRATDVEGGRFEQAVARAREIAGAMTRRDELALIECGARPRVVVPLTSDRRRVLRALAGLRPTDCATNLREGLLLGAGLAARRPNSTVYLLSDGACGDLPAPPAGAQVRFIAVGERCDNLAILAFEVAQPPGSTQRQVFLRLHNYAGTAKQCELAIYHEDDVIDARRIEVRAGQDRVESWEVALAGPGLLRAELTVEDDLAADNLAWAPATPPSAQSVLLVGPDNLFLEQALVVQPGLQVFRAQTLSEPEALAAWGQYDIVIFDRLSVPAPPSEGAALLIAAGGWAALAAPGEAIDQPRIGSWDEDHPALREVNLAAAGIARGTALVPGPEATVIARAGDAPMVVALEREGLRAVALGWDLLDSDLPLRVGFPVLMSNLVRWLGEVRGAGDLRVIRPGETVRLSVPVDVSAGQLATPDGRRVTVTTAAGEFALGGSERVGVYELSAGQRRWRWAVDLRNAAESDLTPRAELSLGGRRTATGEARLTAERHFWPWLVVLALLALIAEWHFYHRRY